MAIIAKEKEYPLAPEGTFSATCIDVVDLGYVSGYNGKEQHRIRIIWQLSELMDDGKPYQVVRNYNLSMHKDASLRSDLEDWRDKPFTKEESKGFDVERVIGAGCLLRIRHNESGNKTYANVDRILPLPKDVKAPTPYDYIRDCDKKKGVVSALRGEKPQNRKAEVKEAFRESLAKGSAAYERHREAQAAAANGNSQPADPAGSHEITDDDVPF